MLCGLYVVETPAFVGNVFSQRLVNVTASVAVLRGVHLYGRPARIARMHSLNDCIMRSMSPMCLLCADVCIYHQAFYCVAEVLELAVGEACTYIVATGQVNVIRQL